MPNTQDTKKNHIFNIPLIGISDINVITRIRKKTENHNVEK